MSVGQKGQDAVRRRLGHLWPLVRLLWAVNPAFTVLLVLASAASGLLAVAEVHVLRQLVNTAQPVVTERAPLLPSLWWGGALALLGLLHLMLGERQSFKSFLRDRHKDELRAVIQARCLQQAQAMPLEQLEQAEHYDRLQRAQQGMEARLLFTLTSFWEALAAVATLVPLSLYLGQFHWGLPLLLLAGTTPGVLTQTRLYRRWYYLERSQTPDQRRFRLFTKLLTGREAAAELRLFGFGGWLIDRAERLRRRVREERLRLAAAQAGMTVFSDGLNALTYLAAIAFSVWLLVTGRAGIGAYAAFFLALELFQRRYASLFTMGATVFHDLRYIQDFFEFAQGPRLDLAAGRRLSGPLSQGIVCEDVSFTYPGSEQPALTDLNLTIRPGERLALVGENGAGKTTLVKLLMGLYQPTEGRILVDGIDLRELAPSDWYRRFGTVFQDFLRYQAAVRDNITFGWVGGAAEEAALATAVARSGADEVVSALDARAEAAVYEHFAELAAERMVVLISHRLGSCRIADRILVLQDGHLVEAGTHTDLVDARGSYAELFQLQAAWYR